MKWLRPLVLFLVGFCVYITIEVCYRGYSFPIMGLCGGIILLLIDLVNEKISWDMDILLQGIIGAIIATLFELVIGKLSLAFNMPLMWNYSHLPFSYEGIISAPYSLSWIPVSILGIFIADAINYYVFNRLPVPYYKLFGKTILRFRVKPKSK